MSEYLSASIAAISANTFSNIFIFLILSSLISAIYLLSKKRAEGFVHYAPNLMTSLGILGTFSGIIVGLMEFNPESIDESIVLLLAGLKTAFLTSLVGMCATIIFKVISPFLDKRDKNALVIGPAEIYVLMNQQMDRMGAVVDAISGEKETSLASQIRLLRTDMNEGSQLVNTTLGVLNERLGKSLICQEETQAAQVKFKNRFWLKMDEITDILSKSSTEHVIYTLKDVILDFNNNITEQLIYALKDMIGDFNNKLTEHFGDNFNHLGKSVQQLLEWQNNYREQMKDMGHKYQLGVDAISITEKALVNISERTLVIPATMEKLQKVILLAHDQIKELELRLDAFKQLRDNAIDAMPEIQKKLDGTISSIANSVSTATTQYDQMLQGSKEMMAVFSADHHRANADFIRVTSEQLNWMSENVQSSVKTFTTNFNEMSSVMASSTKNIAENMNVATGGIQNVAVEISSQSGKIQEVFRLGVYEVNEQVRDLVTNLKNQSTETSSIVLKSHQALSETADIVNKSNQVLSDSADIVLKSHQALSDTADIVVRGNQTLNENTVQVQKEIINGINVLQNRLEEALEGVFQSQVIEVKRTFESLEDQLSESVEKTGQVVEKQILILDQQIQDEVNRVVSEMGQALATVTEQFTRDYTQLTQEMGKVIQSVNNLVD